MFPHADGPFAGRLLLWGRRGALAAIEQVGLNDGATRPLVDVGSSIHVATADPNLERVFFISADAQTNLPTGLWVVDSGEPQAPTEIPYDFSSEELSNEHRYRLKASPDGRLLAIQAGSGAVTIVNVASGASSKLRPGGSMIAFGNLGLYAYGARENAGRDVLLFEASESPLAVAAAVDTAQVVAGSEGDLVVAMRIDAANARAFAISVTDPRIGERIVYRSRGTEIEPYLPSTDETPLGYDTPANMVVLVDSFVTFAEAPWGAPQELEESRWPRLLEFAAGSVEVLGPFTRVAEAD
jgi:hypothetical protein